MQTPHNSNTIQQHHHAGKHASSPVRGAERKKRKYRHRHRHRHKTVGIASQIHQSGDVRGCGRGYFKKTRHRRAGAYAGVGARRDGPTTIRKHGTLKSQMCISSLAFRTDGPSRVPGLATAVAMLFCGILVWVGEGFKEGK